MKTILACLLLVCSALCQQVVPAMGTTAPGGGGGGGTPTLLQGDNTAVKTSNSNPTVFQYEASALTNGSCLLAAVIWYDLTTTITSAVLTNNGAMTQVVTAGPEGAGFNCAIFKKTTTSATVDTLTVTFSGSLANGTAIHPYEFSNSSCTPDGNSGQTDSTTGPQTNPTSGNYTTTASGNLKFGVIVKSGNQPSGNNISDTESSTQLWYERSGYSISGAAGSGQNVNWVSGGSNPYAACGADFK